MMQKNLSLTAVVGVADVIVVTKTSLIGIRK
jgi:hypothetical protein